MAQVSISEAARLTGKSRKTLHTYISSGKLTKVTDNQGKPKLDTSELIRVFGNISIAQETVNPHSQNSHHVTPETVTAHTLEINVLKKEIALLRELIIEKDKRNEDMKYTLLLIESKLPVTTESTLQTKHKKTWKFWKK